MTVKRKKPFKDYEVEAIRSLFSDLEEILDIMNSKKVKARPDLKQNLEKMKFDVLMRLNVFIDREIFIGSERNIDCR